MHTEYYENTSLRYNYCSPKLTPKMRAVLSRRERVEATSQKLFIGFDWAL